MISGLAQVYLQDVPVLQLMVQHVLLARELGGLPPDAGIPEFCHKIPVQPQAHVLHSASPSHHQGLLEIRLFSDLLEIYPDEMSHEDSYSELDKQLDKTIDKDKDEDFNDLPF